MFVVVAGCEKDEFKNLDCGSTPSSYSKDIKPIISSNCSSASCHGSGSANGDYTTYAGLKVVADKGTLENRVLQEKTMPPTGPLPLSEREKLKCWISSGSPNN